LPNCRVTGTVDGVQVGCFPDLETALSGNQPDQVITLMEFDELTRCSTGCPAVNDRAKMQRIARAP
jgi:hypothetical protein